MIKKQFCLQTLIFFLLFANLKSQEKKIMKFKTKELGANFQDFIVEFHKTYKDQNEKLRRKQIFNQNLEKIKNLNCQTCGVTKYSDRTESQLFKIRGNLPKKQAENSLFPSEALLNQNKTTNKSQTPKTFDWRDYSVVTSIKDQQDCGNCWAFSTAAFFESQLIRREQTNTKIDLSEQFLLQCDSQSYACNGGNLYSAMDLVLKRGIPLQRDYPFSPKFWYPAICIIGHGPTFPYSRRITTYNLNDDQIINYLLQRPLNIGIKSKNWHNYAPTEEKRTFKCDQIKNGIYQFDHAVLLIGYTETEWIVKNQWGEDWGVKGFMYISRQKKYNCGIGLEINTLNYKLKSVFNTTQNTAQNTTITKNSTMNDQKNTTVKINTNSTL